MILQQSGPLTLFFTDKKHAFPKEAWRTCPSSQELLSEPPFQFLCQYGSKELILTDQTHGTNGLIITSHEQAQTYKPYSCQADFIVTNVPGTALGIATADCLPLMLYDPVNNVIAAVHAGWQGTVKGIAQKTVETMCAHFGTNPTDIQAFFGPSASVEAYEVSADFAKNIPASCSFVDDVFKERNGRYYFDVPLYNQRLLEQMGVTSYNRDYNECTITHHQYCSYRREKELGLRQVSIAMLKEKL